MRTLLLAGLPVLALSVSAIAQDAPLQEPKPEDIPAPRSAREANLLVAPEAPYTTLEKSTVPGEPDRLVTTYPGNLKPPPPSSFAKEYPICGGEVQDNCRNRGEGEGEASGAARAQ